MDRRRGRALVAMAALATVAGAATADAASAQAEDPGGANGTIKIDGVLFDDHPDNQPKPGCTFQVDFYGFDADDPSAEVVFSGHGGTGGGTIESGTVDLDDDPNDGGGSEGGLDGSGTFDLGPELSAPDSPFSLAPDGRYHVRVDVTVFNSDGSAEARKIKVFKLEGCAPAVEPEVVVPPPTPEPLVSTPTPAAPTAAVAPVAIARDPAAQVAGASLARTGSPNARIALTGLGALIAGAGLLLYARPDREPQPRHSR